MQTRLAARVAHAFRTRDWAGLLLEFAIVVLGVYVAVWVADAQTARERDQRTLKVVATLHRWAQCLEKRLGAPTTPGESCRPPVGGNIDTGTSGAALAL